MSPKSSQHQSSRKTTEFVTRSRTEITAILGRILREKPPLTAYLENGELLMVTRLRHVDPDEGYIVVDYGLLSRHSNPLMLQRRAITFHCEAGRQHVQFAATLPRETVYHGNAAIRLEFPEYLQQHQYRLHPRFSIPLELQMKCVVECPGVISFDMAVQDISRGGIGMVIHDLDIKLEPGTVLRGCLIKHPLHRPLRTDLQIRHSAVVQLSDGTAKVRSGCRFIGNAAAIAELAGMFSVNLGTRA